MYKIVAIGGGSGLPGVLEALKNQNAQITAIVPSSDSGGNFVSIARGLSLPITSDVERCIYALRDDLLWKPEMDMLFDVRFPADLDRIGGIRATNFLTAAFMLKLQDFQLAVDALGNLCDAKGRVTPMTKASVTLLARYANGEIVEGENIIDDPKHDWQYEYPIIELFHANSPVANEAAIRALEEANLVVLSVGSYFNSLGAALIVPGVSQAIAKAKRVNKAKVLYMVNTMTEPGQTGLLTSVKLHYDTLELFGVRHLVTDLAVHKNGAFDHLVMQRYERRGARVVIDDADLIGNDVTIHRLDLASGETYTGTTAGKGQKIEYVRHDPRKLAEMFKLFIP